MSEHEKLSVIDLYSPNLAAVSLSAPLLPNSAVHVWRIQLEGHALPSEEMNALLSADELTRASRFRFARDRNCFVITRSSLRRILGAYTGVSGAHLTFSYTRYGKPILQSPACDIRFNVSHSGALAVIAIARGREVGIDIEQFRENVEAEELARRYFSPRECEAWCALPPDRRLFGFFRVWTCKEAFLKAHGIGLSLPLDCFDVEVDVDKPAALLATRAPAQDTGQWSICTLDVAPGYASALASAGPMQPRMLFSRDKG